MITAPLYKLLKKKCFIWTEEQQASFGKLKNLLFKLLF